MQLKVTVLADGNILVEGRRASLMELDAALARTKEANGQVWYHREAAGSDAPTTAKEVIQRIVALKLPVSLSSKPDFSDWVDAKGVSHPRSAPRTRTVHMPEVEERAGLDEYFATVRRTAAGKGEGEGLVIVKPDRTLMVMPRMAKSAEIEKMADTMRSVVPDTAQRNIAAIAFTVFQTGPDGMSGIEQVGKAIPFFGMLVGLSYIGHAVWVFEGHPTALAVGCRDADFLIVDGAMRPFLEKGWELRAQAVMRNANIVVHNRANFTLTAVRKLGTDPARFEFYR
jgi:hypothetical protein